MRLRPHTKTMNARYSKLRLERVASVAKLAEAEQRGDDGIFM